MRLIHMADLHLGFRAYGKLTEKGRNQREEDVLVTFKGMIEQVLHLKPDLILVAGDVFHVPRPNNVSIIGAYNGFRRLREELPDTDIVMVSGNHDMPRTTETECLLHLFAKLGCYVATGPEKIYLKNGRVLLHAVPEGVPLPGFKLDPDVRNILLLHGEIEGAQYRPAGMPQSKNAIPLSEITGLPWDYVALGHYHVHTRIADHVCYSGSIDYTSSNIWSEIGTPKGIIEYDLENRKSEFYETQHLCRRVADLPRINAAGLEPKILMDQIITALDSAPHGIDGTILRLVVEDVEKETIRDLHHRTLRKYQARATHLLLDFRRPDAKALARGELPKRERVSLPEFVKASLTSRDLLLIPESERENFITTGMRYLDAAGEKE